MHDLKMLIDINKRYLLKILEICPCSPHIPEELTPFIELGEPMGIIIEYVGVLLNTLNNLSCFYRVEKDKRMYVHERNQQLYLDLCAYLLAQHDLATTFHQVLMPASHLIEQEKHSLLVSFNQLRLAFLKIPEKRIGTRSRKNLLIYLAQEFNESLWYKIIFRHALRSARLRRLFPFINYTLQNHLFEVFKEQEQEEQDIAQDRYLYAYNLIKYNIFNIM